MLRDVKWGVMKLHVLLVLQFFTFFIVFFIWTLKSKLCLCVWERGVQVRCMEQMSSAMGICKMFFLFVSKSLSWWPWRYLVKKEHIRLFWERGKTPFFLCFSKPFLLLFFNERETRSQFVVIFLLISTPVSIVEGDLPILFFYFFLFKFFTLFSKFLSMNVKIYG